MRNYILFGLALVGVIFLVDWINKKSDERQVEAQTYLDNTPVRNQEAFKNEEIVGTTNDGQIVKRVVVEYVTKRCEDCNTVVDRHFVYFVGKTITDNAVVPHGKSTRIEPRVDIVD